MTRHTALAVLLVATALTGAAQRASRAQQTAPRAPSIANGSDSSRLPDTFLAYSIEVTLDPDTRMLDGGETIRWTNPSAIATITRVPVHLYLNAFANEASTWMRSVPAGLVDVQTLVDRYGDPWGWSEPRSIRQGGAALRWHPIQPDDGNPLDRSLIEVELEEPVEPGATLVLEIDFDARLPVPIARTGGDGDYFMVAQWFPKVAAFETAGTRGAAADGWNAHQFYGQTEFYADYADFDVRIYVFPALTLKTLENLHGRATLDRIFATYYQRWRFRHPRLEDFIDVVREVGGESVADFFAEAYRRPALPDYRIEELSVDAWQPLRGRFVTPTGVVEPTDPRETDRALTGLDPGAREMAGTIVVERLDPGDVERNAPGGIERLTVTPDQGRPEQGWEREPADAYYVSTVRVAGPGWDYLPVEIEFRFAETASRFARTGTGAPLTASIASCGRRRSQRPASIPAAPSRSTPTSPTTAVGARRIVPSRGTGRHGSPRPPCFLPRD